MNKQSEYDDIIDLPHHVSVTRKRMSSRDRAAQFSPFAALTGYDAEIRETARLTDERREPDEYRLARIDACLQLLVDNAEKRPDVTITFFKTDERKSGGAYITISGSFRRFDESDYTVVLTDGTKVPVADIYSLDGDIFRRIEE